MFYFLSEGERDRFAIRQFSYDDIQWIMEELHGLPEFDKVEGLFGKNVS